jgi:8-oxo-dGTP diphosphatase
MERQAVYGILFDKAKENVLLVKRRDIPVWVLPGGGLDLNESPEEGVLREVEEECGCKVSIVRKIAEYLPVNNLTQKTHFFECSIIEGSPKANEEAKEVLFFPLNDLPKKLAPPFPLWIQDALKTEEKLIVKPTEGVTYLILIKLLIRHPILIIRYLLTKLNIRFNSKD